MNRGDKLQQQCDATDRWDQWILFGNPQRLVVHPDDWRVMDCPTEYEGLPVKPLGIQFLNVHEAGVS